MNQTPGRRLLFLPFVVITCLVLNAAPALQDGRDAAQAKVEITAALEELGTILRAAVMSDTLSGPEAREIYSRIARVEKASYAREFEVDDGKGEIPMSSKGNTVRLMTPQPREIRLLLEPEFLPRDLSQLGDELDLDRTQMTIAGFLFADYVEAYELASAPLREALAQYRSAARTSYIVFLLESVDTRLDAAVENARQADRDDAAARMTKALARIEKRKAGGLAAASDEQRRQYEQWQAYMLATASELDHRLVAIRDRAAAQLANLGRPDSTITADDLLRMARRLLADRTQLRADLTHSLDAILTDGQRGESNERLDRTLGRIRLEHLLPRGRLGGESMNLWVALQETRRGPVARVDDRNLLDGIEAMLADQAPEIAAQLDARTSATLDREIEGLALATMGEMIAAASGRSIFEIDERRLADARRAYAAKARVEIDASVTLRDTLLALLDESKAYLAELDPDSEVATRFRDAALRRGFPIEMRPRWAERALAAARKLEHLEDDVTDALTALQTRLSVAVRSQRARAIAMRIERDPKLARDFVRRQFEGTKVEISDDVWREVEHAAFATIDDHAEGQLRLILTTEQFASLPARPSDEMWGVKNKDVAKGKSKDRRPQASKGDESTADK